jgi:ribosomal protein S18 acetylase RimI-like enzyme
MINMENIDIRPYLDSDWEDVCRIHDLARPIEVHGILGDEKVQPLAVVAKEDGFFENEIYVALNHQKLVGVICINGEEISWLYVDPAMHGKGIGTSLVNHVRNKIGSDGFVMTTIENESGVRFYKKVGFQVGAIFPGGLQGKPCTCVRLALTGSKHLSRKPKPMKTSLILAGYDESDWGEAQLDGGIWKWKKSKEC